MERLPQELIWLIISALTEQASSTQTLAPLTTISRRWQTATEALIWKEIQVVYVDKLDDLTSGDWFRRARRGYIRTIDWWACIDYSIPLSLEEQDLCAEAFTDALQDIYDQRWFEELSRMFQLLYSWEGDRDQGLGIELALEGPGQVCYNGEGDGQLPRLSDPEDAASLNHRQGWRFNLLPYLARLGKGDLASLPTLSVVNSFSLHKSFSDRFWPASIMEMLAIFPNLRKATIDVGYVVISRAEEAVRERRQGIADTIHFLPPHLDTFELSIWNDMSLSPMHNAVDYLSVSGRDELSISLRVLSMRLRNIRLRGVRISSDLFWPVQDDEPFWLNLEQFEVLDMPPYSADGLWLLYNDPFKTIDAPQTIDEAWEYEDERGYGKRGIVNSAEVDKLYVAAAYAVQKMPCLKQLTLEFRGESSQDGACNTLSFVRNLNEGSASLVVRSQGGYKPGEATRLAWRTLERTRTDRRRSQEPRSMEAKAKSNPPFSTAYLRDQSR
ncbi:hypothetical protein ASPZODRAFT_13453 [Penicilliopsis zonata CBS 506.65]|uniref:Uncharacterized protein n=1 Tax=Penicilliopsis zonata CBS 506.65 TaxID=1073090 RepID=A0A1L9ST43_9EURO|nr:hypothetical protein ASPZODRAFT_13453 [Penicilliopsis zonata CBS 506.65]OJJ50369.1 hypothetical protein ASPZODRAFT_13453 [Penicilliopsis zonata CBS 506.65]